MSLGEQTRRLLSPGREPAASANAYLALTGVLGLLLWGITAVVSSVVPYEISVTGPAGQLVGLWALAWGGRALIAVRSVDRTVWLSSPMLVWGGVSVLAFAATGVGLTLGTSDLGEALMWTPWAAAYAVGYAVTGLLVERGRVYLLAAAASVAVLAVGLTVGVPRVLVVLGLLHAVPMLVDAARGGRELTDEGIPAVQAARTDTAGGLIESD